MRIELNNDSHQTKFFDSQGRDITRELLVTDLEISQHAGGQIAAHFTCLIDSVDVVNIPEENIEYTMLKSHEQYNPQNS